MRKARIHAGGEHVVGGRQVHVSPAGVEQGQVFGVAVGVAQRVGQQQGGGQLTKSFKPLRAGHMVAHGLGDAFPGGVVLGGGAQAQQAAKPSMPHSGWPCSSTSKRCNTKACPSSDTSVWAVGNTRRATCMHRCSFCATNGNRALEPLMMWRRVMTLAFLCSARAFMVPAGAAPASACASRNLGSTPETPLVACWRTRAAKAASELSPLSSAATSMGWAGSLSYAPGAATCRRPTMLRPMTDSRAMGLAPMCGPKCSCSTWSR